MNLALRLHRRDHVLSRSLLGAFRIARHDRLEHGAVLGELLVAFAPVLVKILAIENRFIFGVYRRQMKAIRYLGEIDRLFGVPATTRNWNTMTAIANVLGKDS